ncbi:MAG: ComF family protein [Flavobacteriales bacterium]
MKKWFTHFFELLFPRVCGACGKSLVQYEDTLCLHCEVQLPRTRMHDEADNRIEKLFWGRADIQAATALLKMPKKGIAHHLIHELKYNNNETVGSKLGTMLGHELKASHRMNQFDCVIPVPLHPRKKSMRGYNQCDSIADGVAKALKTEVSKDNLVRQVFNNSQTRRKRYERWENVNSIFKVKHPDELKNKHVLLVDDVITTGSTIEACAMELTKIEGLKLSVATLAMPVH